MWYVFVAGPPGDKFSQFDETISGGFVGGQYASHDEAMRVYEQTSRYMKAGEVLLPPFEAANPQAAREYVRRFYQQPDTDTIRA